MCHKQKYLPLNGCNANVLWDHKVCLGDGLNADTQQQRTAYASIGNVCAAEREQLIFVLLIIQEAAIPVTLCDWSTTIDDSCPWIIHMSLMYESYRLFSW